MSGSRGLEAVRAARRRNAAAKVEVLRGGRCDQPGFEGMQLMLEGMRIMLASRIGWVRVFAVPIEGGYALCLQVSHGPRVWLIAEKSKRVRVFRALESLVRTAVALRADHVILQVNRNEATNSEPHPDLPGRPGLAGAA
jgi:hypothetical protein